MNWFELHLLLLSSLHLRLTSGPNGLTFSDAERHSDHTVGTWHTVQTADEVGEVIQHTQVVLHHNDVPEKYLLL